MEILKYILTEQGDQVVTEQGNPVISEYDTVAVSGIASVSTVSATAGALVANQRRIFTGTNSVSTVTANAGTVTARQAMMLSGTASVADTRVFSGTIITNKARFLAGEPSRSSVFATEGVLTANRLLTLSGTPSLSTPNATAGILSKGLALQGNHSLAGAPATAGTSIILQTILDQYGYRFRNDDGSETTATFITGENLDITSIGGELRIRFGINGTNSPQGRLQLEYRLKKDGEAFNDWRKVS